MSKSFVFNGVTIPEGSVVIFQSSKTPVPTVEGLALEIDGEGRLVVLSVRLHFAGHESLWKLHPHEVTNLRVVTHKPNYQWQ